jgi:hypothetical protein
MDLVLVAHMLTYKADRDEVIVILMGKTAVYWGAGLRGTKRTESQFSSYLWEGLQFTGELD